MVKKTEDTAAAAEKKSKAAAEKKAKADAKKQAKGPVDPAATKNLIQLLNILALLLAIGAFLLQLFAVLSHHWKWQVTDLHSLVSPTYHYSQPNVYDDSRLDQEYGLFSRHVKIYANNDEQLDLRASTRFPRLDDGDSALHRCLSQTSTLRGAFLTCSPRVVSPEQCHCRRHAYWNFVIFFEILALILLGIAVLVTALLTTQFHGILKPAGAGVSLLAFLLLFIGLILILSHLKRETRSFADAYPHIQQRLGNKLSVAQVPTRVIRNKGTVLHQAVRRQSNEIYRAYPLLQNQHPYNDTHFQEYSDQIQGWVYKPYTSIIVEPLPYSPLSQQGRPFVTSAPKPNTTPAPTHNEYGPLLGYDTVFASTRASIGWSTVLSILALILSLLLPLVLIFSWLKDKELTTNPKPAGKTEYAPVPQNIPSGEVTTGPYDPHVIGHEPTIIQDVVIHGIEPIPHPIEERSFPVTIESQPTTYQT